jgi:type IV secretion system protein VirB10
MLYRSQVIAGILLQAIQSDVPGPVRLMVSRPVLDRFQQRQVLIPQHSEVISRQEGTPAFGQTRLRIVLEELHFPDGTIVTLPGQLADRSGAIGTTGKVNNHYVKLALATLIATTLNVGTRVMGGSPQNFQPTLEQEFTQDIAKSVQRTGQSVVDRTLNVPPTITIPAGTAVTVVLDQNLSLAGLDRQP